MPEQEAIQQQSSDPEREITVRRIDFTNVVERLERDFARDDVVLSHLIATLSGLFPDGEEMFVESVRHYREQVTDPDLRRQVNAFIGQEAMHSREHRRLNDRLAQLGYRSKLVEKTLESDGALTPGMRRLVWLASRVGPLKGLLERLDDEERAEGPDPVFRLAMTSALEHYTATMAHTFLTSPELTGMLTDDEFLRFWAWHAVEESEHKAVAFDVYRAIQGDEETRLRAIKMAGLALMFIAGYHTTAGVLRDRRSWIGLGLAPSLWRLRKNPFLTRAFRNAIDDYRRPDFHPLQHDTTEVEERWRAWLDGDAPRPLLRA